MAIKGSLKEASLPDVIQLISMGQKTGILTVTEKEHFGSITFFKGNIVDSYLINRKNRIGEILVASGEMSEEQLDEALEIQKKTGAKIGKILMKEKFVREDTLITHLRQQIQETIITMMTWENGYFNFEPRFADVDEELIAVNPATLLLESARQVDERSSELPLDIIRESSILKPKASEEMIKELSEGEKKVYSLIDGEKTLEVIIEFSPFDTFDTKGIVSALVDKGCCGVIERVSHRGSEDKIEEHLNLGIAFLKTQLFDEAEREFKHIIKVHPKNRAARFYLSVILTKTKNYREAEELLRKLLKEDPESVLFLNNLGYILAIRGRSEEAFELFEEAAKDGKSSIPILNMAIAVFDRGDFKSANQLLHKALEIDENSLLAHFYLALLQVISGKLAQAAKQLQFVIEREPNIPILHYNLGVVFEKLLKLDAAEECLKRALDLMPNYFEPRIRLGDIYYRKGLYAEAQKTFGMVANAGLGDAEMFLKMGNIHYKKGQKELALEQWRKALSLDPENEIVKRNIEMVEEGNQQGSGQDT
jgi:tetratricopeptide (TPR) repeat protein